MGIVAEAADITNRNDCVICFFIAQNNNITRPRSKASIEENEKKGLFTA